jgi:hypothetical protein
MQPCPQRWPSVMQFETQSCFMLQPLMHRVCTPIQSDRQLLFPGAAAVGESDAGTFFFTSGVPATQSACPYVPFMELAPINSNPPLSAFSSVKLNPEPLSPPCSILVRGPSVVTVLALVSPE